ncbi:MAG: tRNA-dihydrouridine synthase family protein [Clostridia bacterium]|nr:tRNA-dihydrouridine synthase family protein [Clostridia bacterium]MBQ4158313.1 tRNA-dihydrouridine synthase family protein [Clostridia bacterium]MBQ4620045.1 tRNA-dihydrouridine synthase family protein [Clostridia bacterium]MBQ9856902.1 tRNA-dihydrouridine synthase family protein [Clostridia bacterium]
MGIFSENHLCRLMIASLVAPSNVLMAPIYGYSNASLRMTAEALGAGIAFTEMVHVEDLLKNKTNALEAARFDPDEKIKAIQLIGGDPKLFRRIAEGTYLKNADLVDINMGCAVPEIVHSGRGCALVHDLKRASQIIEACKKSGKAVSVKCRPGMTLDIDRMRAFARMCEDSGTDLLTIHGRAGEKQHEGPVSYEVIAEAKASVGIPVIGNGGIFSEEDAVSMIQETCADGVMIGRYALENPEIFRQLTGE